jgi:hypothetical protein
LTERSRSRIKQVLDSKTFLAGNGTVSKERRESHLFRGWHLTWLAREKTDGASIIDHFDPDKLTFELREPRDMHSGDVFEVYPSTGANWNVHHNIITDCLVPVTLSAYGSSTSNFESNTITRGAATGIKAAVQLDGQWWLTGNILSGFDEPNCVTLMLLPDRFGNPLSNTYHNNTFENCIEAVGEARPGLWKAAIAKDNIFVHCGKPQE